MNERLPIGALFVASVVLAMTACISGSGSARVPSEGGQRGDSRLIGMIDARSSGDAQVTPRADARGAPLPDRGTKSVPDTYVAPTPDTAPAGPSAPFGSSVGMTANNVTGLKDCDGKTVALHDFYNTGKGVVLMLNKAS